MVNLRDPDRRIFIEEPEPFLALAQRLFRLLSLFNVLEYRNSPLNPPRRVARQLDGCANPHRASILAQETPFTWSGIDCLEEQSLHDPRATNPIFGHIEIAVTTTDGVLWRIAGDFHESAVSRCQKPVRVDLYDPDRRMFIQ